MTLATTGRRLLDGYVAPVDVQKVQRVVVVASPDQVYTAIWAAGLLRIPLGRGPRRLGSLLAGDSPWMLLADEPGRGVAIGLLWRPPAGIARRPAAAFAHLTEPGLAKVGCSLTTEPFGAGHTLLIAETRVQATDPATARRVASTWGVLAPLATLLGGHLLRAVARHAQHSV